MKTNKKNDSPFLKLSRPVNPNAPINVNPVEGGVQAIDVDSIKNPFPGWEI